jgi:hypothetical protein
MKPEEIISSSLFDLSDFAIRSGIDLLAVLILVGFIYYPKYKNKDFVFTFSIFNVINFMICYLLGTAKIQMGFAFGLFAIFSIIRYRTIMISIKDMGYFFICVALGMLNSLADSSDGYLLLIVCNLVILAITLGLDRLNFINNENSKEIIFDNVGLIRPSQREALIKELRERTELNIHRIDVVKINYLKDTCLLKVYYYSKESESHLIDSGSED